MAYSGNKPSKNKPPQQSLENQSMASNGPALQQAMEKALKDNESVALDVGSNIGVMAHSFLLLGYSKVHLFEPSPCMIESSKKLLESFGDKCVYNQVGISDSKSSLKNVKLLNSWVMCGDGQEINLPVSPGALELQPTVFDTELITLDDYCKNLNRVDLLKIDVEGYEHKVLLGAKETIDKFKPIILLELSLYIDHIKHGGIPLFIDHIYELGYNVFDQKNTPISKERMIKQYPYHSSCDIILYPKTNL